MHWIVALGGRGLASGAKSDNPFRCPPSSLEVRRNSFRRTCGSRRKDHHGRRSVERDWHGVATRRTTHGRHDLEGSTTHDRVRPAATAWCWGAPQGRRQRSCPRSRAREVEKL